MRINRIKIQNYRTIEHLELEFPAYYAAISGKNNSGKSNVIKAIRSFFREVESSPFSEDNDIGIKTDLPNWLSTEDASRTISFELSLLLHRELDAGLYRFVVTFLALGESPDELMLTLRQSWSKLGGSKSLGLSCQRIEIEDAFKIEEVFKKIRSSRCLLFHNSTAQGHRYIIGRQFTRMFGGLPADEADQLKKANTKVVDLLRKSAQRHQKDIIELLGRLEEKYNVTLSLPPLEFDDVPFMVSLGDKSTSVPLDDWGSGTQNRTLIFLNILRAKKNREVGSESDRITPILLIEEPESFLHPSAQAEFGKMLQEISEELCVQVVTTTHSPYMLSLGNPRANLLLERRVEKSRLLDTQLIDAGGDNWMEPFGLALGIDNEAFASWRNVLFKRSNQIVLVEGETDVEYFKMLRDGIHGSNAITFEGEVFPYGGVGFFSNSILIKFVMSRFSKFVITYDLDHDAQITKALQNLGLKKGVHFFPIGQDKPGKRDVEGLLPDSIRGQVYSQFPDLVAIASSADKERDSARRKLKEHLLSEFRSKAQPGTEDFSEFYKLSKAINRAFK
ncbi:MAG: AAA family ATPase [Verrucomicrobiaceae bacterium]|nr:AAA family ATPase [Verrucomicrobiaceae bacterium]